ncbi:MAG: carbon-nitrogen hydrolase family protein [Myxococcota bacterium]
MTSTWALMKLAAIQYKPPKGNVPQAHYELGLLIDEAAAKNVDFIVLPEMATTGYIWDNADSLRPHAEHTGGRTFQWLAQKAIQHTAWIVCGYAELDDDGRLFNSALVVNSVGELVCSYRKVMLFEADLTWAQPGKTRFVIPSKWGRIAPIICMDLNDDQCIQFLKKQKIKLCAFCTHWVEEEMDVLWYWRHRLGSYNGFFVAANSWGQDNGTKFCGLSAILGPKGKLLAQAPKEGNAVIVADAPTLSV